MLACPFTDRPPRFATHRSPHPLHSTNNLLGDRTLTDNLELANQTIFWAIELSPTTLKLPPQQTKTKQANGSHQRRPTPLASHPIAFSRPLHGNG
ncbi:MAG: hypothetical protein HC899_36020 [Leptolyngbyaceae cyanobacterium SM1_4_3]|nr:hypothetical protein [Leptolyngbyaceae cyanobacterium SM1_4_3]